MLYEDGTWKYVDSEVAELTEIKTNPKKFKKGDKNTFLLKSRAFNAGLYINPKKWTFIRGKNNEDAEYELQLKGGDLYGMIITEKIQIPILSLREIALSNARDVSPDIKITKEEYRNVNGQDLLLLQMDCTLSGIKFSYYGYYNSNENGTVQYITYTAQILLKGYIDQCEALLNGLVVIEK